MSQHGGSPLSAMMMGMIACPSYLDSATKKKYLPFMLQCRLIKENKSKKWKTIHIKPCIDIMGNYSSYSWSDFIAEYKLNIETSYICIEGAKVYFICVGSFACAMKPFTRLVVE
jgi:hypothetical protein